MQKSYFQSNDILEEAVLNASKELGSTATEQINQKVFGLLENIILLEDVSGRGTKLNYRLRWCKAILKSRDRIKNIARGTLTLI